MHAYSSIYDPYLPELAQNPYKIYQFYQSTNPVHLGVAPNAKSQVCWYIFGYSETRSILTSPHFGRVIPYPAGQAALQGQKSGFVGGVDKDWMVYSDPPQHTRLKGLVGQVFAADFLETANIIIREETVPLVKDLLAKKNFDLISELAELLPARVMTRLFGLEESQREIFNGHVLTLLAASHQKRNKTDNFVYASRARLAIMTLLKDLVLLRAARPAADLVSRLVLVGNGQTKLSQPEIVSNCLHLLVSGYGVVVNLIGNALLTLLNYPGQLALLESNPFLCSQAIEEVLRFESPLQMVDRWVQNDTEIAGTQLKRGERVYLVLGAANRDPGTFLEPDTFDITREKTHPLAFGGGIHSCLGRTLALAVGQAVLTAFLPYLTHPWLKMSGLNPAWEGAPFFRGLRRLDIVNFNNP
jgi:cytochrome P450